MKMLVQSDDYGFTKAVTYGINEAINNGILTCAGMLTNMEIAPWVAKFVKKRPDFCFGIDLNVLSGPAISNKSEIPHLVDENGRFIRSSRRVNDPYWTTQEGQEEMFPYEEVKKEFRAQYDRFVELTGRRPGYVQGHSLTTASILKAIREIANEEDLPYTMDYLADSYMSIMLPSEVEDNVSITKVFNAEAQLKKSPLEVFLKHKDELLKQNLVVIEGHMGYVDQDLMLLSSVSLERMKDLELATSVKMKDFVRENKIELVNYYDLIKERKK